jgi:hypothetical protein
MSDELKLRALMEEDAKIYRVRNQIAEKTDPQSKTKSVKTKKVVKAKPSDNPTEEPPQ